MLSPWLKQQQALENQRDRLEKLEKAMMDAKQDPSSTSSSEMTSQSKKRMKIKKSSDKDYKTITTLGSDDETDSDYSDDDNNEDEMELSKYKNTKFFTNLKKGENDKENLPNNKRKKITKGKTVLSSPSSPQSIPLLSQSPNSLKLLSPNTKDRAIKELLLKGREQERLGNLSQALSLYLNCSLLLFFIYLN